MSGSELDASLHADLVKELREALNWWDVLEPLRTLGDGAAIPWNELLQPAASVHVLPQWQTRYPQSKVELLVRTATDRIELTLRFDYIVIWQRALFYQHPPLVGPLRHEGEVR